MRTPALIRALAVAAPLALAACGGAAPTAVPFPTVIPTRAPLSAPQTTRTALAGPETPVAALATPGAPLNSQATASRAVSASPSAAVATPGTVARPTSAAAATARAGVPVDLGGWFVGAAPVPFPAAARWDPATGSYTLALTDTTTNGGRQHRVYDPAGAVVGDGRIAVDARLVDGAPASSWYGLLVRVQRPETVGADVAGYLAVFVSPGGRVAVYEATPAGEHVLIAPVASAAVRGGQATNRIAVVTSGSAVIVEINGDRVAEVTTTLGPGAVGLAVSGGAAPAVPAVATFAGLVTTGGAR